MSIAGSVSFLIAMILIYTLCWRANKVVTIRPWATGLSGQLQKAFVTGVPSLKRSELQAACEDFSNIIGSLSHLTIYKGTLSSGVEIAVVSSMVKSAKDWSKESESQFRKKVTMLSKVNHKNILNLLVYCEKEEPFTRIMVFEYAPNGTLYEHLHGSPPFPNASFGWVNVQDVAKAHILAYEVPSTSGRYYLVERVAHFSEIVKIIGELYPAIQRPK